MSRSGFWHYEYSPEKTGKVPWRVGNEDDGYVTRFATEREAVERVDRLNELLLMERKKWQYGSLSELLDDHQSEQDEAREKGNL